jgi:hypothetical protein
MRGYEVKKITAIISIIISAAVFTNAQQIPQGVHAELSKFTGLPGNYVLSFPEMMNERLKLNEAMYHKNINSNCQPRFDVQYISKLTNEPNQTVKNFESGFIGIEVTFCFSNTPADKVMSLFFDPEFQAKSVSTIKSSYLKDGLVCEKTTAPTIGNSHYCYSQSTDVQPGYILGTTFNVWNDTIQNANAPVYFRQIMASATQVDGGTEFHLQTLVRGPTLNFVQRLFAKSAIVSEQQSIYEKMKQRLQ